MHIHNDSLNNIIEKFTMVFSGLKTLPRDIRYLARLIKIRRDIRLAENQNQTVGRIFDSLARKHPDKVCFYYGDETWSYKTIEIETNKIGNYYASQGLKRNDVVPIFMDNRIEFLVNWLALSKIGVVPALLNSQLRAAPLRHSVELIKPAAIICGYELSTSSAFSAIGTRIPVYATGRGNRANLSLAIDSDAALSKGSAETPKESEAGSWNDDLFYIYTSGTTGLPKAAIFKQSRYIATPLAMRHILDLTPQDTIYTPFPLYHTAGGIIAVSMGLILGIPVVIAPKFSATHFWADCAKYNVTGAQYIGETCRYLLRQPAATTSEEKQHKLRLMFGNGLRQDIWTEFKDRFNIPRIVEMYGATEGNCNMFNVFGHHGAVGFIPPILQRVWPSNVFQLDENDEPIRDPKTGFCVKAQDGQVGEILGQIMEGETGREFKGYAGDESATKKKIIHDVFKKGDRAFRSGDLLVRDKEGYFYFKDRIGDTFRWKGENVSTAQVESILSTLVGLQDVVVYGVEVPNCDGRAGMAAIAIDDSDYRDHNNKIDLEEVAKGLVNSLPSYAIPLFLRITNEIELTGTLKMKKYPLQKQGFDLNQVKDDQYFFDKTKAQFVPLTKELLQQIISGHIKL